MLRVLVIAVAYLLGSIPFGYLLVRLSGGGDVREKGSGGTGATNVTRRAGKKAGLLTLALDALKGALAVILARALLTEDFGVDWWGPPPRSPPSQAIAFPCGSSSEAARAWRRASEFSLASRRWRFFARYQFFSSSFGQRAMSRSLRLRHRRRSAVRLSVERAQ